jgi:hypothetical protein
VVGDFEESDVELDAAGCALVLELLHARLVAPGRDDRVAGRCSVEGDGAAHAGRGTRHDQDLLLLVTSHGDTSIH